MQGANPCSTPPSNQKPLRAKENGRVAMKLQQEGLSPLGEGGARHKVWLCLFQGGIRGSHLLKVYERKI